MASLSNMASLRSALAGCDPVSSLPALLSAGRFAPGRLRCSLSPDTGGPLTVGSSIGRLIGASPVRYSLALASTLGSTGSPCPTAMPAR